MVALALMWLAAGAVVREYVEDFTTKDYCDTPNTTADWNTDAGELRLFPFGPTLIGDVVLVDVINEIAIAGDHAYLANGFDGLTVVDISDPTNPTVVGGCATFGTVTSVAVDGDHAYVVDIDSGLSVMDISDPTDPSIIGSYSTYYAAGIAVAGNHAYVADLSYGLWVIDISDPTTPSLAGTYSLSGATGIELAGDCAYVARGESGLYVVDISDPTGPTLLGSCPTPGDARELAIAGNVAYVAQQASGLVTIDISDPASPTVLGTCDTPGIAYEVATSGDYAYVADSEGGLRVVDITDPSNPVLLGWYNSSVASRSVTIAGEHAYLGTTTSGLRVVDICDRIDAELAGSCDVERANDIEIAGDCAFVAGDWGGFVVIDIGDPWDPSVVGSCQPSGHIYDVEVAGDHAYVVNGLDLQVVDVSDPALPTLGYSVAFGGYTQGVALSGNEAYVTWRVVGGGGGGVYVFDISDPTNLAALGYYSSSPQSTYPRGIDTAGDWAYAANAYGELMVFDISDPTSPALVATCPISGSPMGVVAAGDVAYVVGAAGELHTIDISDPTSPVLLGSCSIPVDSRNATVVGDWLFVDGYDLGVCIVNISDPANPVVEEYIDTPGWTTGVAVAGSHVFAVDSQEGLQVLRFLECAFDIGSNEAMSLDINPADHNVACARAATTQADSIRWRLSADGGATWDAVRLGPWHWFDSSGNELLWRSTHIHKGRNENPACQDLLIEWWHDVPLVNRITDIPGDQGGQVTVSWTRSGYDLPGCSTPVTEYGVFRRVDVRGGHLDGVLEGARGGRRLRAGGPDTEFAGRYPPGDWDFVVSVPACCEEEYAVAAPTLADSTVAGGAHYSVFFVTALTNTPGVYYDSPPDSGCSIDNLEPSVPGGFVVAYAAHANDLSWDGSSDPDLAGFRIYRGLDPEFTAAPENLVHTTTETAWTDGVEEGWQYYYKISAIDLSGNESDAAPPESTTGVDSPIIPEAFALHQNTPNPITGSTTIRYDVPTAAGHIKLRVFDAAGRLVRILLDGEETPGRKGILWDGRDERGRLVASGVYYYRLETEDGVLKRKTVVLR